MYRLFLYLLFGLLPVLALLHSAVPLAVQWAWSDFLAEHNLQGDMGSLQWQLRRGSVQVDSLSMQDAQGRQLRVGQAVLDIEILPLLQRRLVIEKLSLNDAFVNVSVYDGGFNIAGLSSSSFQSNTDTPEPAPTVLEPWKLVVESIEFNRVELCADVSTQGAEALNHCASLEYFQLAADLDIAKSETTADKDTLQLALQAHTALRGLTVVDKSANQTVAVLQQFSIDKISLNNGDRNGDSNAVSKTSSVLPWQLELDNLQLQNAQGCTKLSSDKVVSQPHYCADIGLLNITATSAINTSAPMQSTLAGELGLERVQVSQSHSESSSDQRPAKLLVALQSLQLEDIALREKQLTIERLALNDTALLARSNSQSEPDTENPYHAQIGELDVTRIGLDLTTSAAAVSEFTVTDLNALVHRDHQTQLPAFVQLQKLLPTPNTNDSLNTAVPEQPAAAVNIGRITFTGQNRIRILDDSVQPPLDQTISELQLSVANLDSQQPQQKTALALQTRVGDFGSIDLQGWAQPFRDSVNVQLDGDFKAMELVPYSPYSESALGYTVQQGLLDNQLRLAIVNDQIDAELKLKLQKVELQSVAPEAQGKDANGAIPLNVGLMLLRDSDDNIALNIPVSGDVSSPDFSVQDAVFIVGRKLLTQAVLNYYTPYGLVNLGSFIVGEATKIRFDDLEFTAAEAVTDTAQLSSLAELLTAKKQLSLVICPVANGSDFVASYGLGIQGTDQKSAVIEATEAQNTALLELANRRGLWIKTQLLEQGAAPNQVVICAPALDLSDKGTPVATVAL